MRSLGPGRRLRCSGVALLLTVAMCAHALAARIVASVTDESGKPLANAVVTIAPAGTTAAVPDDLSRLASATIDQHDETFIPEVVVIHTGGSVTFRDSDTVRHHVYSFSPIKQFQFVQHPGEASPPVQFDHPGVVAIGCNIHDFMIAYVFVTDASWALVTRDDGQADFTGLPSGNFTVTVWHPRLWPDSPPLSQSVALSAAEATLPVRLRVMPRPAARPRNQLY